VRGVTMDDCVALARRLGERVAAELEIPVYLYARAATRPERERLPEIRKGEFEGLRDRIGRDPAADPDFGPRRIHPTAGATAIGARPFLVAFNIYLDSSDVAIAKEIAKQIRTSSGGLPAVQASGFEVAGQAQVSMNLLDIDTTSPAAVFAAVAREARARGVDVLKSEVVGLVPERAILGAAATALKLPDAADHLLEAKIRAAEGPTLDGWLEELAGGAPVPGRHGAGRGAARGAGGRDRGDREQECELGCEGGGRARRRGAHRGDRERAGERRIAVRAGARAVAAGGGGAAASRQSATVRIRGSPPFSTIATVCSKWADSDPSSVTTVHLSSRVRISGPPTFTIGSIAMVIPGISRGPRFGFP